nr:deoxyhypusine synthase family protein [uncultured Marinifilum sp.]
MKKKELLKKCIQNIDITTFDSTKILNGFHEHSDKLGNLKEAVDIYLKMLNDKNCNIILAISGNANITGDIKIYSDFIKYKLVDAIIIGGANLIDIDFFEALGFNYYKGSNHISDSKLHEFYINRCSERFVDEDDLLIVDETIKEIADQLSPRTYSSRELISEFGKYLQLYANKKDSIIQLAYENCIPVFCPDLALSRAGYGLLKHYHDNENRRICFDPLKDLSELGDLNNISSSIGIVSIGEDIITNMAFNTVKYSEQVGGQVHTFKYSLLFSDINSGDRTCHFSNLSEAHSKGFIKGKQKKHICLDPKISIPLLGSALYHSRIYTSRKQRFLSRVYI